MIVIKNRLAQEKMARTGQILAEMFELIKDEIIPGKSTLEIDKWIDDYQKKNNLKSSSKGYHGYRHSSCISINDVVVHGIPQDSVKILEGDLVKIDVCASHDGFCADMARCFFVGGTVQQEIKDLVSVAQLSLDKGISQAYPGKTIGDISSAIEIEVKKHNYGIVKEFAGHGIGKKMHEDPEILNYGKAGCGPVIRSGMAFAIEPMITLGDRKIFIEQDGWTVRTMDKLAAAHVEDTVIVTDNGPRIITRL